MKEEVIQKLSTLIATAFGLVAALAWNDTIKAIFGKVFEEPNTIPAMVIYATLVTVIAVVATIQIGKAVEKAKKIDTLALEKINKIKNIDSIALNKLNKINNIIKSNIKK